MPSVIRCNIAKYHYTGKPGKIPGKSFEKGLTAGKQSAMIRGKEASKSKVRNRTGRRINKLEIRILLQPYVKGNGAKFTYQRRAYEVRTIEHDEAVRQYNLEPTTYDGLFLASPKETGDIAEAGAGGTVKGSSLIKQKPQDMSTGNINVPGGNAGKTSFKHKEPTYPNGVKKETGVDAKSPLMGVSSRAK